MFKFFPNPNRLAYFLVFYSMSFAGLIIVSVFPCSNAFGKYAKVWMLVSREGLTVIAFQPNTIFNWLIQLKRYAWCSRHFALHFSFVLSALQFLVLLWTDDAGFAMFLYEKISEVSSWVKTLIFLGEVTPHTPKTVVAQERLLKQQLLPFLF